MDGLLRCLMRMLFSQGLCWIYVHVPGGSVTDLPDECCSRASVPSADGPGGQ